MSLNQLLNWFKRQSNNFKKFVLIKNGSYLYLEYSLVNRIIFCLMSPSRYRNRNLSHFVTKFFVTLYFATLAGHQLAVQAARCERTFDDFSTPLDLSIPCNPVDQATKQFLCLVQSDSKYFVKH